MCPERQEMRFGGKSDDHCDVRAPHVVHHLLLCDPRNKRCNSYQQILVQLAG
jgi:hypothetical protein